MGVREVEVVLNVTFEAVGRLSIDVAEYDEWRGDRDDSPECVQAFIESDGDGGWNEQSTVYEDAKRRGTHEEIVDSVISRVRLNAQEATR